MRIISSEGEFSGESSVLIMGMFDGVHLAHQQLIRRGVQLANEIGAQSVVCTFSCHPMSVLHPENAPQMLITLGERLEKFRLLGADCALIKPFTRELACVSAEDFLAGYIEKLRARAVVAGYNYTFGFMGRGNADMLREMGGRLHFRAEIMPSVEIDGERVSSTLIRGLMLSGDNERAQRLLSLDS